MPLGVPVRLRFFQSPQLACSLVQDTQDILRLQLKPLGAHAAFRPHQQVRWQKLRWCHKHQVLVEQAWGQHPSHQEELPHLRRPALPR